MHVVFLYGPPGVGKYTVGCALAERTGFKLLHNHLTVNLVGALFERETEQWLRLLRRLRREVLHEAARENVSVILTAAYSGSTEHLDGWRQWLEPVSAEGGSIVYVQLTCEREALLRRVQHESRRALDKLVDPARLLDIIQGYDIYAAAPLEPRLMLDLTHTMPAEAAQAIIAHFQLPQRRPA